MGVFSVTVEIAKNHRQAAVPPHRSVAGRQLGDDWIASDALRKLGIKVRKKDQLFVMANGQTVTRDIGYALIRCGEFETVDEIVFAHTETYSCWCPYTRGFNATSTQSANDSSPLAQCQPPESLVIANSLGCRTD